MIYKTMHDYRLDMGTGSGIGKWRAVLYAALSFPVLVMTFYLSVRYVRNEKR
jgi:hypothetical protein